VIGSSFQVGWQIGVYNVPFNTIKSFFNQTSFDRDGNYLSETSWTSLWSLTNALNPAGGIIGGLVSGAVADYFGRKKSLLYINAFTFVAVVLGVISKPVKSFETVIAGRFFAGLLSGLFLGVAPLYLSEIPPKNLRGITGVLNQLTLVIGILFTNIIGLPALLGSSDRWPYLVGIAFIPMIVHIIGIPFCTETPKYIFINKKNPDGARQALLKLRKNTASVDQELNDMKAEMETQTSNVAYLDLVRNKFLFRALVVTIGMLFLFNLLSEMFC
jgi:MFS transporter, SP family, solute carrier family 2 (facilitated glucose transporter), member 1